MKTKKTGTRTLLLQDNAGGLKLEIPLGARLTYGPVLPKYHNGENAVRIYQGETLVAFVPGVKYFFDANIVKPYRLQTADGKDVWKEDDGWFGRVLEAHNRLLGKATE